jgi:hypothetical protein
MPPWNGIFHGLMKIMDIEGPTYFSGPRFLRKIADVDAYSIPYTEYLAERRAAGHSTTRSVYFRDLLMALDESRRVSVVNSILDDVEGFRPEEAAEVRRLLGGGTTAPMAAVPPKAWNADRLNNYLRDIDAAIAATEYDRAVTLSYTCMEGFLGAFMRAKYTRDVHSNEIIALSREVKDHLRATIRDYPDEVLNGITQAAYTIDRSRNRFSESHFGSEAGSWLAM